VILHDYFDMQAGGERVVQKVASCLEWPIVAGFESPRYLKNIQDEENARAFSWARRIQTLNCYQGLLPFQIMGLIRGFRDRSHLYLRGFYRALYSGTYAPLGVLKSPARLNIYYCHSPARFVYDQRDFYFSTIPFWQRPVLYYLIKYFKPLYENALPLMDIIIANSYNVKARLSQYLGLDSVVVHPPCDTYKFRWQGQDDFYLSTARLDPLKRVDILIEAFKRMPDKKLVVVSEGPEAKKLRQSAVNAHNIQFLGWVPDAQLKELMGKCIATVYLPRDEDFGMSPVESMASGKPVIGVQEGGLMETICDPGTLDSTNEIAADQVPKKNLETSYGLLVKRRPTINDVIGAVQWLTPQKALEMRHTCERRARNFDTDVFVEKIKNLIFAV